MSPGPGFQTIIMCIISPCPILRRTPAYLPRTYLSASIDGRENFLFSRVKILCGKSISQRQIVGPFSIEEITLLVDTKYSDESIF